MTKEFLKYVAFVQAFYPLTLTTLAYIAIRLLLLDNLIIVEDIGAAVLYYGYAKMIILIGIFYIILYI